MKRQKRNGSRSVASCLVLTERITRSVESVYPATPPDAVKNRSFLGTWGTSLRVQAIAAARLLFGKRLACAGRGCLPANRDATGNRPREICG
jgi:hypothetical protein